MKNKIIIGLIGLNFILTQLEVFLPMVSGTVNIFALLLMNLAALIVVNKLQLRPSLESLAEVYGTDSGGWVLRQFDVQVYLISAIICSVTLLVFLLGHFVGWWQREAVYDLILLLLVQLWFLFEGEKVFERISS